MNAVDFTELLTFPNEVTKEQTVDLEAIINEFPYFQTARVLCLKGLKNQKSYKYNTNLKTVAAYTANRTILFDFITADTLCNELIKNELDISEIEVVDSKVIESLYESIHAFEVRNYQIIKSDTEDEEIKSSIEKEKESNIVLEIGTPIDFNKNDTFSFNEWLKLPTQKPIKRIEKEDTMSKKIDLIDQFIQNKPKIKPVENQEKIDVAKDSVAENAYLMTETLARVYLEQKKYDKAISAFKILSLKYPEKSSFFADRIKAIKILKNT